MKIFVGLAAAGAACLLLSATLAAQESESPKSTNILYIMVDDLGWKDLNCQGNDDFTTVHIDRLAAEGMRFTNAYAAAPVCSPTRAAAMTGLAPARLQVTNHNPDRWSFYEGKEMGPARSKRFLEPGYETVAERLQAAGYATAFFGKWHLSHEEGGKVLDEHQLPQHQGFDINVGGNSWGGPGGVNGFFDPYKIPLASRQEGEYLAYRLADEVLAFLKANQAAGDKPFFACLWNYVVHWPIEAPQDLVNKYGADDTEAKGRERYQAMVEAMDIAIGRVLKGLDDLGLREDTLVLLTSDNGPLTGYTSVAPLKKMKGYLEEGGIRVPMIVRWPGQIEAGSISNQATISMDFLPTFMEVAGIEYDADRYDGESLLPVLRQQGPLQRESIFFHYPHYAYHRANRMGSAIRTGDYKLMKFFDTHEVELYNLEEDIGESRNLASDQPERAKQMEAELLAWLAEVGAEYPRAKAEIKTEELAGRRNK